jgi:hypothetical protein
MTLQEAPGPSLLRHCSRRWVDHVKMDDEGIKMEGALAFTEEFYNALESAKRSFDVGLIYLIHVLYSPKVGEDQKQERCDEIVGIGKEVSSFFSSVKLGDISKYNIREYEQRIERKLDEAKAAIDRFTAGIDKKLSLPIDRKGYFSIDDIVAKLGSSRIYGDYAFTKDKLDSLLVIRKFIIAFYESMVGLTKASEKKLDKDFYELRLKTFLGCLHDSNDRNADFAFLSVTLFRKLILDGAKVLIADPGKDLANRNELFIFIGGERQIVIVHSFGGTRLRCEIGKADSGTVCEYRLTGFIELKGERVEYSIEESVRRESVESFEHILGLDFIWAQYDKAFLAYSKEYNELKDRGGEQTKAKIKDAAFDILFG